MNSSIAYLVIAGLSVNGVHAYLLFTQERRWSISEHGISGKKARSIYTIGHFIGVIFLFLFARQFYLEQYKSKLVFSVALLGAAFEILQAIVPAKGKYNIPHVILAYGMWLSYMATGFLGVSKLPLPHQAKLLATPLLLVIASLFVIAHLINRNNVWKVQMAMIMLYPVSLGLMLVK